MANDLDAHFMLYQRRMKTTPRIFSSHANASHIISGTHGPEQKVYHTEKPISKVYPVIDNDLARDNVENDIPAADLEDL